MGNRYVRWSIFAVIWLAAIYGGLKLRHWHFTYCTPLHYHSDINNAVKWGQRAVADGYFNVYDKVLAEKTDGKYGLDYPPLRLAVAATWGHYLARHYPDSPTRDEFEFYTPFLRFNQITEVFAAVAVFLLVLQWTARPGRDWRNWTLATIAALWLWFNPAILINSHARPAGDAWIVPFFLWAIWLAGRNWWTVAGAVVGTGAMLKGQQLIIAPLFLLWPLFAGKWSAIPRWLAGFLIAVAVVVSPWMLTRFDPSTGRHAAVWPIVWLAVVVIALGVAIYFLRGFVRRWPTLTRTGVLVTIAAALLLCMPMFGASRAWFKVPFQYGSVKHRNLSIAETSSLASILRNRYSWGVDDVVWKTKVRDFTIHDALKAGFLVLLTMSAAALAIQQRRKSPRFLIAVATPWLVYFAFAPQIHERYLIWAAGVSTVVFTLGVGWALLSALVCVFSWQMTIHNLLHNGGRKNFAADELGPSFGEKLTRYLDGTQPDVGWAIMLLALIFLYHAWVFDRTDRPPLTEDAHEDTHLDPAVVGVDDDELRR
jgi:hypothetical protein